MARRYSEGDILDFDGFEHDRARLIEEAEEWYESLQVWDGYEPDEWFEDPDDYWIDQESDNEIAPAA